MAALLILQADARVVARLYDALAGRHELAVCSSWESLFHKLGRASFDGCLVATDCPDRSTASRQIEELRERHPGVAIVACVERTHPLDWYDLGGLGVAGILVENTRGAAIRDVVDEALTTARADGIARSLAGHYASPGPDAIGWAVEHAGSDTNVEKLAAALGHTPRTLRQALEDAGLPGPTRVLLWGRLLLAGARLSRDGRTVEDVAFSLGYATATSLSRAMKNQTGMTAGEISVRGGMERVRDALFPQKKRGNGGGGRMFRIATAALLIFTMGCARARIGGRDGVDRDAIDAIVDSPPMERLHFGVLAVDAHSGRTLYERNARQWFVPASNQKILLTAAAWSLLGPEHRFLTEVWATGVLRNGLLDGDLVVLASGDPSFSGRFWESGTDALEALAGSIAAAGVQRVTGALLIDVSAWDSTTVAPTREVADLVFGYGATGGAFAIDEGELQIVVRSAPWTGLPADVDWWPRVDDTFVTSKVRTVATGRGARVLASYQPERRQIELDGTVEEGRADTLAFAQRDPVRLAGAALAGALQREGVAIELGWDIRWTVGEALGANCLAGAVRGCPRARRLAGMESPPVAELVDAVLAPSQNWIAEQLTLALGAQLGGGGSWPEGLGVLQAFLRDSVGIDSLDVSPRDGSGLSAYNLVTPRALTQVLLYMASRPDGERYRAAMAEPGESGSTLEERLGGLEGSVFAKTGTISNVNALSGYIVRDTGQLVIFSILANGAGLDDASVEEAIDAIVRILAR